MSDELMQYEESNELYSKIVNLITSRKTAVSQAMNAAMCKSEGWTVRTLRDRKNSMLYERTAISRKPEKTIRADIMQLMNQDKMSLDLFYRDPYVLDFLGLKDTYSEKDLENAILAELERFILEMGSDFAFLARQKHFVLDGKDYYMDSSVLSPFFAPLGSCGAETWRL